MRKAVVLLALLAAVPSKGQVQFVSVEPECRIYFSFTAVGVGSSFDNRTRGCNYWIVSYSSYDFAGPLSLSLQSAPNVSPGVPGAWVNFAGTIDEGINPNTSTVGAQTKARGYYPWIRMNLTATGAGAGLVVGTAYGWRSGPVGSVTILGTPSFNLAQYGGVAVGAGNALHVRGPEADGAPATSNPVQVAGVDTLGQVYEFVVGNFGLQTETKYVTSAKTLADGESNTGVPLPGDAGSTWTANQTFNMAYNGSTWDRLRGSTSGLLLAGLGSGATGGVITSQTVCNSQAAVSLSAVGLTEIIPLIAGRTPRICHLSLSFQAAVDVQLSRGTGSNCATGTTAITGTYQDVLTLTLDFANGPLQGAAGEAVCVNLGAAVTGGGVVVYANY